MVTTEIRELSDLANSDILYISDLEARLEQLEDWIEREVSTSPTAEERAELVELRDLMDELGAIDDTSLLRDSYMETYAREFASDIGAIEDDARWPATHIDWKAATEALKMDYTEVEIRGVSYWYR